jgi:virginiamycin A acetyltransferase
MNYRYFTCWIYKKSSVRIKKILRDIILRKDGGQMFSTTIRSIYKREHNIEIAYCSYGGCFSLKNIPPGVSFGNYCSIAPDIYIL